MNDMIETSSEEVMFLLLSFSERLHMNPQYNLLDGTTEDVLSRICNFLQEKISSLIMILRSNLSSIQIDETKLALMWGAIRCYPRILDVQTSSSLLMDLIDALDLLTMSDGGNTSSLLITNSSFLLCMWVEIMSFFIFIFLKGRVIGNILYYYDTTGS